MVKQGDAKLVFANERIISIVSVILFVVVTMRFPNVNSYLEMEFISMLMLK